VALRERKTLIYLRHSIGKALQVSTIVNSLERRVDMQPGSCRGTFQGSAQSSHVL
jgi:hypothetical protein